VVKDKIIGMVIPYFNAQETICKVVENIPDFVDRIVIVDDCSSRPLPRLKSGKAVVIRTHKNLGVGGATIIGFKKILEYNPYIVVKMDADDQMDPIYLPDLVNPIIKGRADYSKGNRFRDFKMLRTMPYIRRICNLILSFLTKIATGYWNIFDPSNGYFAIKSSYLKKINLDSLDKRYFFETSLLAELYFQDVRVRDVPMPALYHGEPSGVKLWKEFFRYPFKLLKIFLKRIFFKYFLYDFNMASLFILFGIPLFLFGIIFGLYTWINNVSKKMLTPTGTLMLIALSSVLGFQLILQAIQIDMEKSPKCPDNLAGDDN
jgi:dolichol-phosphate mannosyltransferase